MRISLNGTDVQASTNSQSRINKSIEMDSVSKSINNQIANAQKQLQELSENKDMSMEEKMKKRQEIQRQITDLNTQLRQHQMEQRKEQQKPKDRSIDSKKEVSKEKKQTMGLSQSSMKAMICADSALSLAKAQGNVVTKMEGRANVLETEIKLGASRGSNVEAKKEELAEVKQKASAAEDLQMNVLMTAKKELEVGANEKEQTEKTEEKEHDLEEQTDKKEIEASIPKQVRYRHIDVCL